MAKLSSLTLSLVVASIVWGSIAPAEVPPTDTVELSGGGQIAGRVLKEADLPKGGYVSIQVDDDLAIAVESARVTRVRTRAELDDYARRSAAAGDDPEKHYQLGKWCTANHLSQQRLFHYTRAITLNPEHSLARAALDYVRDDRGNWIPYAMQQRNRGLIWAKGGWQFPEFVAKERAKAEAKVTASKWIKQVSKLRSQYLGRGKKQQEAFLEIRGIRDPLASDAIANELQRSRGNNSQPPILRMEWVRLLGLFRTSSSVRALVLTGLEEPDANVREAAFRELEKYGQESAIATYAPMLKHKSVQNVRRGLRGLLWFPKRSMAFTYIDALATTHLTIPPKGPGISTGFTDAGGGAGSFSTGSNDKPIPTIYKNTDALTLLKTIEPNVDYGFNEQAWREHFARQLTAYRGSLRRDP